MALLMTPIAAALGYVAVVAGFQAVFGSTAEETLLLAALLYFIVLAFMVFVFWATRGLFQAFDYVTADGPITMLILLLVFLPPVVWLPWTWFSVLAIRFGRQVGSRLWQATGVIYLIAMAMILASAAMLAFGAAPFPLAGDMIYGAPLALLLGWVCHGTSMIVGARMTARI
ncbi:MAG: hypothetical protein OXH14_16180 [Alphaproteobacteria bacterium]|nr:hypothetical protein [Alphaproteobacteria bacterium]